jgi:uncharacterized membrane protein YqjE
VQTYDVNYLNMAKIYLKVFKHNCCRLMKSLLYNFLMCKFLLLSLSVMLMAAVNGKSRLSSAVFCTEARCRRRVVEEGFHL